MIRAFLLFLFSFYLAFADALTKVEQFIKNHKDPKIQFTQKIYISELEEWQEYQGSICIKEDKIKITYLNPQKQEILIDGKNAYIYSVEENQLLITDISDDMFIKKVVDILSGKESIKNAFKVIEKSENYILLKPKKDDSIPQIKIFIENSKITKITAKDKEENQQQFILKKIDKCSENLKLNTNEKTEVIRQ